MKLEKMNDFFAKRIDGYETQMLENVEGCKEGYIKLAELIPISCKKLLDLENYIEHLSCNDRLDSINDYCRDLIKEEIEM